MKAGRYKFEAWGAQGGDAKSSSRTTTEGASGGYGGYVAGTGYFTVGDAIFAYVGGAGTNTVAPSPCAAAGGYNGGEGSSCQSPEQNYGRTWGTGGGGTDFRLLGSTWDNFDSIKSRIMVAGGGGGAFDDGNDAHRSKGGDAGGLTSYPGVAAYDGGTNFPAGTEASQTTGGYTECLYASACTYGRKAYGTLGKASARIIGMSAGGGAGWYGGGSSLHVSSAAGGSSFIAGHSGCNAINISTSTSSNIVHTGSYTVVYNGRNYEFQTSTTLMIDGAGYKWTNTKGSLQAMPKPAGGTYASGTGHTGNGYARITYLGT